MESIFFFFSIFFLSFHIVNGIASYEYVYPNFTASNYRFIDTSGTFLYSRNGTFKAAIFNHGSVQTEFYFCVIHVESHMVIWSANGDNPISNSGQMRLTRDGMSIIDENSSFIWSTEALRSTVSALKLTETGNLMLIDRFNGTLWESFGHPTDTIVIGQRLFVGAFLSSGDYRLMVTVSDAIMQWQNLTYWDLSMDNKAYRNSFNGVEYMAINQTGLFLFGGNGSRVVIKVDLSQSDFKTARLDDFGQFVVSSYSGTKENKEFPGDRCRIPFICGKIGLCTDDSSSGAPICSCPSNFQAISDNNNECVPSDASYSLFVSCNSTNRSTQLNSSSLVSYSRLGNGMDYFANDFTAPVMYGVNLTTCQDLCAVDCSCLGIFFDDSSGSCYTLQNVLGSIMSSSVSNNNRLGFIKTLAGGPSTSFGNDFNEEKQRIPLAALVLLPFSGFVLLVVLGFLWWRRSRVSKIGKVKSGYLSSPEEEMDAFTIPGLPVRFDYDEIESATDNFKTQIGSGGFGTVYKGELKDGTQIAVKKITNLGLQGKKDFFTEIVTIGNVHHVNLVKLRGFCAQGRQRMLVYEYMNRGSLDCTLFGAGPVLEWQERIDIALGTARGLAYLHSGCEQKIIHCDVKPENILLHDNFQAKISDFGLSKLLSPQQSSLFTTMRGTRGYLAPEWLTSSTICDKTDVYSFGMVLLELVSGQKNCSFKSKTQTQTHSGDTNSSSVSSLATPIYFPLFALEMHEQKRYFELADPRLEGRVSGEEVEKLVKIALCCVHEDPVLRPSMITVVGILEGITPLCEPMIESLTFLRFIGRRFVEPSVVEESGTQNGVTLYPHANTSRLSTYSASNTFSSYISSHQVSGPR